MKPIRQVAIVGGTHGNELTGAYLIKKFEQFPDLIQRSSFTTQALVGNPQAVARGQRYIDKDLNRCFLSADLQNPTLTSYEDQRAKAIQQQLGLKGQAQVDLIVDLHSTTANMGLTLLLTSFHPFNLRLAAYLCTVSPHVRVYSWAPPAQELPFLRSLTELGCGFEVGAIAQGVLQASVFQQTESLLYALLDYLDACNQGRPPSVPPSLTLYQYQRAIDYPRNAAGDLQAMIHPQLQFRDYEPLHPGDPLFLTLDGQTIPYDGDRTVYPVFINEAAYYEKGIALCVTERQEMAIE